MRPALSKAEREERKLLAAAIKRLANYGICPGDIAARRCQELLKGIDIPWTSTQKFSLPPVPKNEQSPEKWIREANEKYRKFRDDELRKALAVSSVDFPVAEPTKRRGPGKKRRNASIDKRYEWAALRWLGCPWGMIAPLDVAVSTVTKAGNEILRRAGLLDKPDRK